ncbi:hypothetical protein P1X15_22315 [Runella sp. MFBS21]|uniref:hypothetical protein n=1 Tax=Runella sp. MFBS21 TaxID=3034018 RepID=UPI0023F9CC08|nr:hypothetical protein [Runella sp. MFBS21]MDF7820373.1 hypothetical protein [Runella sp. MFBS21]
MKAINDDMRSTRIINFGLCYAGLVVLFLISLYLNFRKIPEIASEMNRTTAAEMQGFLQETTRLDDYVRILTKPQQYSPAQYQKVFGFINQLKIYYNKPLFLAVLKSYEAFVGDLGNARNIQDDEWAQLATKYNQLLEERKQLEQQLSDLQKQRTTF